MDKAFGIAIILPMRFLMLNWRDPKNEKAGGAERVSLAYLSELVRRGHEVYWFANTFGGAKAAEVFEGIQLARGGREITSIWRAIRWYRQQKPFDLVIDQHHGVPWYAPWWCRTNCVAYIHEILGPIWKAFYPWMISAPGQVQERWTLWLYRNVPFWTPSESTRRLLIAHGVRQVKVIANGCDTLPLSELESKPLQTPLRLVAVSRLAPNKRVDHAIRLVRRLLDRGVDTQLVVMGNGEADASLRQLVAELNLNQKVRFAGRLGEEEKNAQLRQAHFLVHTSIREGWGLNVIESNAMGTPAIVYAVGGLVDSTVDGVTGRVVATETPQAMADELQAILKTPAKYDLYRQNAWQRSKDFQWKTILPRAADWLETLASSRRS